jgi:hypothetical protein
VERLADMRSSPQAAVAGWEEAKLQYLREFELD